MDSSITLYLTLVFLGSLLVGMEIFLPGGVLGVVGALLWLGAAIVGAVQLEHPWNLLSGLFLLIVGGITFLLWFKFFPKSRMGKVLTLQDSAKDYKAPWPGENLTVGMEGEALTVMRPAGTALFDGKRVDVVADGEWIEKGDAIKIVETGEGHIVVAKI
jgi:membrane-bound serine protease (ClpP class)